MPTYQYACTDPDCDNRFERVQAFTDTAVAQCPVCAQPVRKVYGSVGVVFKGSGFYRTDSRAESRSDAAAKSGDAKSSDGPSTTKPDSTGKSSDAAGAAGATKDGAGPSSKSATPASAPSNGAKTPAAASAS